MTTVAPNICRNCMAFCPVLITVENGVAVKAAGDPEAIEYDGYICPKGRALPDQLNAPDRLLTSVKRIGNNTFTPIAAQQAVDEVADKLKRIVDKHGPRAVAMYVGTGTMQHPFGSLMATALFRAIGSPMVFTATTIDKPAERIAAAMHGHWIAGGPSFEESDAWMLIGANPIIAKSNGLPYNNPGMRQKEAVRRGMKMIVIDPRRTETARRAHIHLQARPGEDPTLLAGIINIIMAERLYDEAFVSENASGFAALKAAVAPFTVDYVASRADVPADDLVRAARTFATAKKGAAVCATGPSFSMRSNLTWYLSLCLNTVCGRWKRAGERAVYPNVLLPAFTPKAQPLPPYPIFGEQKLRVMNLRDTPAGMPTGALVDEILHEGEGQVKALFCIGGNPMSAFPDQRRTEAALRSLDLLVSADVMLSATAKLAHYVIAPPMPLEQPAITYHMESIKYFGPLRGSQIPWAQYSPAAVKEPPGSDLMPEHAFFFLLAQKLQLQLNWVNHHGMHKFEESPAESIPLDITTVPSLDDIFELAMRNSRVPLAEVKKHPHGKRFDIDAAIEPRDRGCTDRLQLADPMMIAELAEVYGEDFAAKRLAMDFPFQLVCRRANNTLNSIGTNIPAQLKGRAYNTLQINPHDVAALRLREGQVVEISSRYASILGIIEGDDSVRPGVVSMTQGFGARGEAEELNPYLAGSNVNLLMHQGEYDPISGIARMSALPVAISSREEANAVSSNNFR
jgi:anaerobic selenocysteine-containing dehydrogenase